MKLVYCTRGNSTPQGKPRVYFTGHPADLSAYREEIFKDIFRTQNCAIYYDENPLSAADQDDLLRELEQMQLIVVPVTSRFLYQANRARDVEFSFAMEHHIPVLPLMQENGLETVFNEICGDLQMLNKNDPDPTALPYAEKLEKFLASVLVGDELAEKVRAAFDAYVFLSYRKKDRKYAQELMKLIHKNDFCRDIAIWYDEFLIPGENFNDAIADALKKSSLFTLAVTPNVVEPGNYVMSLEYPEAKRSGKPILPVELVPTNKETLQNSFQDIPPCADAYNDHALSTALLETVKRLALQENDGSPEHNFFIGLAYLNGIDVEVNRTRALSLIISAAESGLPEAIEKLVSMYRSGDGVQRDYRTAIGWQEKLAKLKQARYEYSGMEEDGISWTTELHSLGEYLLELGDLAAAKKVFEKMNAVCQVMNDRYGSRTTRRHCSISYFNLGGVCLAEGRLADAKCYFLQSLETFKKLCEEIGTVQARRDLVGNYRVLGVISEDEDRLADAENYYLQSLGLTRQLAEEVETVQTRHELAASYTDLGDISKAEGRLTDAKNYYLKSLGLTRQLTEETGTMQARRELSISYDRLGDISRAEGRLADAKSYFLQSLELSKQLAEETGTVQAWRNLSINYDKLGDISQEEGRLADAKNYYLQSMELARQLTEEIGTVQARHDLSANYISLGNISREEGRLADAKNYFLQSLELSKQLTEETGTVQSRRNLSINYNKLGNISQEEGRLADAKNYYLQSLELARQLAKETGTVQARRNLAGSYTDLGNISRAEGRLPDAENYCLQSLELTRQLAEETGTVQARRELSASYHNLSSLSQEEGKLADAENYCLQSLELAEQLLEETGTVRAQRDLAVLYNDMIVISVAMQDNYRAIEYAEKMFPICMELCCQTGVPEDYHHAAVAQLHLGMLVGNAVQKQAALSKAYNIWCELTETCSDVEEYAQWRDLAWELLN